MNALAILIFLICFGALSAEYKESSSVKAKCLKEVGLNERSLQVQKNSLRPGFRLKCFYRCILEHNQLIANNKIIPGALKKKVGSLVSPKNLAQVEASCHGQDIDPALLEDKCDFANIIYKCYSGLTWKRQTKIEDFLNQPLPLS